MRRTRWCIGVWMCVFLFATVKMGRAAKLVSPLKEATYEVGQSIVVRVEPEHGEKLIYMQIGFEEVRPNERGILEYSDTVGNELGRQENTIFVYFFDSSGQERRIELFIPLTVVLPSTTTVTGIGASFTGQKKTFPSIARKPSGEFVALGHLGDRELSVGADYSDGVARDITNNPDVTYKSMNEKVAIVFPPGQGKDSRGDIIKGYALVRATGPGKTSIIVQYGELTDRVTVNVKECPYTEGMKRCPR